MSFKLSRFPAEKQDQIEQLIAYAQLLGLSGKDLVAIGGKMDRDRASEEKRANMAVIESFDCLLIGRDNPYDIDNRFKLKTVDGAYNFVQDGYHSQWVVTSLRTKVQRSHYADAYNWALPKTKWRKQQRYAMLLDINAGRFKLDF